MTRRPALRSLGGKLVLALSAVGVAGALAITALLASVIVPSFNELEARAIAAHVERTEAALSDYAAKVESAVRDYGDWTASYDYMAHPTRAFEEESFSPLGMSNLGVQGMAYVGGPGRVVVARWREAMRDDPGMRAALVATIARTDLGRVVGGRNSGRFYARLGDQVAAIGVAQVRRSDGTGAPRGYVLMARTITSARLAELLQLDARIASASPGDARSVAPHRATIAIRVPIRGADGRPVASTAFSVPREASLLGRRMLLLAIAGSTLLLLIVLAVLRRLIGRLVLAPLRRVEAHMQKVRASGSLALFDDGGRRDELGSLGASLNAMLRQLKDLREQIEAQSFALGRSESAVAMMHNVRNALNPVSTILSQGVAEAAPVDRAVLDRALAELARDGVGEARRARLAAFVQAAVAAQEQAREATRAELQVGREAMAHVLEIIGQQQRRAHERPEPEVCDVTEIVQRNAAIARYSHAPAIAVEVPLRPHPVLANRVILSQVIGNLFGNAAEAIAARGEGAGRIAVDVEQADGQVVVRIADTGEGFDAEVGATLFQRGFSTRAHKSGGLGLHWCANSMTAMDGALTLESEGPGRGAVAVLTLRAPERAERAEAA